MRIERTPKQIPEGAPRSSPTAASQPTASGPLERMVWEELAPRLLHPTKLAFIQALLESGEPLSSAELAEVAKIAKDHAEYHCKRMRTAGVLEVVKVAARKEGEGEEPFYFFTTPLEPVTAPPSTLEER
jgi:DNA-binding transcriptional ArsR family regulator